MNEKELLETAVSLLTSAACEDVTLLGAQKVALFPNLKQYSVKNMGNKYLIGALTAYIYIYIYSSKIQSNIFRTSLAEPLT